MSVIGGRSLPPLLTGPLLGLLGCGFASLGEPYLPLGAILCVIGGLTWGYTSTRVRKTRRSFDNVDLWW